MPYILNTEKDSKEMLDAIGASHLDDLFRHLPAKIKIDGKLNIPSGLTEQELKIFLTNLAAKNEPVTKLNSFLGAGIYNHYIPSAIKPVISRAEFLTAYTPYQAECSQGILQAIYEYQSYMCLLTGMDVSNASLFDGASSLAESVLMALRITKRNKVIISSVIHPEYKQTLHTYIKNLGFKITEVDFDDNGVTDIEVLRPLIDDDTACFVLQSPNFFGVIEDVEKFSFLSKEKGALSILVTNPMSLALLKSPGKSGIDMACGDGQVLGGALSLGGPTFGFITTRNEFLRQMPGRIVGKTTDKDGKTAYCLTLQAREQHIKREKATSNICSNQSLNAISAAVYLSLMGKQGLYDCALYSLNLAHYLRDRIKEIKQARLIFSDNFFNEFVWHIDDSNKALKKLYKKGIIGGLALKKFYPSLKDGILSCCTEMKSKQEIDELIEVLRKL